MSEGPDLTDLNIRRRAGKRLFLTSYQEGDGFYGAEIEAENITQARQVALARGLGERVEGFAAATWVGNIGRMIDEGSFVAAAHEAAFLCFLGLQSGAITPRDALGDNGLVHELLHLAADDPERREERALACKAMAKRFAHRIPGYPVADWPAPKTLAQEELEAARA